MHDEQVGSAQTEAELIQAFLHGARHGTAGRLYVEADALYLDGWWQVAFRLAPDAHIVSAEPPPEPVDVVDRVAAALRGHGLQPIPGEHPLVHAVTYAELSITGMAWTLWATDALRGEQALAARAAPESMLQGAAPSVSDHPALGDLSAEFAKSMLGGMPRSIVLAVGLADDVVAGLAAAVPDCQVESRPIDEAIGACGAIVPHLVVVDASAAEGRRFLLEFRAEACGRFLPVAAVTGDEVPPGATVALDPRGGPSTWQQQLLDLLP